MIRYRLACKKGHEFEGWFASSETFDRQAEHGRLTCPTCGTSKVAKSLMAPSIVKSAKRKRAAKPREPEAAPQPAPQPDTQRVAAHRELAATMRKLRAEIEAKSDNVGKRFAEEARKIHYEETPARGIHGEATADEAKSLADEGIEFFPLPVLPEDHN
jgi:hypothetical protein